VRCIAGVEVGDLDREIARVLATKTTSFAAEPERCSNRGSPTGELSVPRVDADSAAVFAQAVTLGAYSLLWTLGTKALVSTVEVPIRIKVDCSRLGNLIR
jgi:hypothetical protein